MITSPMRPIACESDDDHADGAEVVQHVLGGDRLGADARLGEGEVLGDRRGSGGGRPSACRGARPSVLTRERHRRVGGRRQHVRLAAPRAMMSGAWPPPAPSVWYAWIVRPLNARDRVFHEARLVQRVGVDRHLDVALVGHATARSRWPPASMPQSSCSLRPDDAGGDLLAQRDPAREALPLPRKPRLIGNSSAASSIAVGCSTRPACTSWRAVPVGRAGAAADQRGETGADAPRSRSAGR